jgi:hypothetical protein
MTGWACSFDDIINTYEIFWRTIWKAVISFHAPNRGRKGCGRKLSYPVIMFYHNTDPEGKHTNAMSGY